jgi:NADPH:quinone reductase-like Zn-dependent oxidoreductase
MKALILHEDSSITLDTSYPVPSPVEGSVVVRILATHANPNFVKMVRGDPSAHMFTQPRPLVPGGYCLGRIAAAGPDTTVLKEGQLVTIDHFVRARDDPNVQILRSMHDGQTAESKKLHLVWRDGTYAEYCRAPLENVFALDEKRLCGPVSEGGFGYSIDDLSHLMPTTVPFGGLRSINVKAGETVIVSPATGLFSGSAISVALAMGADVIAVSRNADGLTKIKTMFPSVSTVQATGDAEADTASITAAAGSHPPDAFIDLSPPESTGSSGVTACMLAVKPYGRIVLMGGRGDTNIPIPWGVALYRNLTIKGGFMYERDDVRDVIRLLETGRIKLGEKNGYKIAGKYGLEEWEKAADAALEHTAFGSSVVLHP